MIEFLDLTPKSEKRSPPEEAAEKQRNRMRVRSRNSKYDEIVKLNGLVNTERVIALESEFLL